MKRRLSGQATGSLSDAGASGAMRAA